MSTEIYEAKVAVWDQVGDLMRQRQITDTEGIRLIGFLASIADQDADLARHGRRARYRVWRLRDLGVEVDRLLELLPAPEGGWY